MTDGGPEHVRALLVSCAVLGLCALAALAVLALGTQEENEAARPLSPPAVWPHQEEQLTPRPVRMAPQRPAQARVPAPARPSRAHGADLHFDAWPRCTQYDHAIEAAALWAGLAPRAIKAQMIVESGCRPRVCSSAGACGLMQLLAGTARDLHVRDRYDPVQSLRAGAKYQAWQENQWARHGRTTCERRANGRSGYNAGLGVPLACQRKLGGYHMRDWRTCLPAETWDYSIRIAKLAGEEDCILKHGRSWLISSLLTMPLWLCAVIGGIVLAPAFGSPADAP